jgi:hypothetical protein
VLPALEVLIQVLYLSFAIIFLYKTEWFFVDIFTKLLLLLYRKEVNPSKITLTGLFWLWRLNVES